jgi:mRNA-degrading endonuclease RelE of RelBE toxin-antitoxin system
MEFRIADTFTASLSRLNGAEQKAVKTTAFDLQLNLSNPGLRFHRLDRARDPNFWSVRVNDDVRLICTGRRRACFFATSGTTTRPMRGPSGARSNGIR